MGGGYFTKHRQETYFRDEFDFKVILICVPIVV